MENWKVNALKLFRGVAIAALVTLPGMLLLAACVVLFGVSDGAIGVCNQLLKALAVFMGAVSAVGRGGSRGFVTGAAVGLVYMLVGYGVYCALDGSLWALGILGAEALFGAAIGALSGAIAANMRPARKKKTARAAG